MFGAEWMPFQFEGVRESCCGIERPGRQQWSNTGRPDSVPCLNWWLNRGAVSCHCSESSAAGLWRLSGSRQVD